MALGSDLWPCSLKLAAFLGVLPQARFQVMSMGDEAESCRTQVGLRPSLDCQAGTASTVLVWPPWSPPYPFILFLLPTHAGLSQAGLDPGVPS